MTTTDCTDWEGTLDRDGYGRAGWRLAHRMAYEQSRGPIPAGLEIDHLCRNRACVNPDHLEAVTHAENMRRAKPFSPLALVTHCKSGHEFTTENTYYRTPACDGLRSCRTCNRDAAARYKTRRSA